MRDIIRFHSMELGLSNGRCGERQQSHISGSLDGQSEGTLVFGAVARDSARRDFSTFRCEIPEGSGVLIIDH